MKRTTKHLCLLLAAALTLTPAVLLGGCGSVGSGSDIQAITFDGDGFCLTVEGDNVSEESVFTSTDIIYYEDLTAYPSGNPYGEGEEHERHTVEDAAAHTVVNITQPGTYRISGSMEKGQIRVDLGEDAFDNPEAVVTLVLDGLDINCDVAPAILFLNVYECDNQWSADTAKSEIDTASAGANLIIADGTINNIDGGHVARIYKDNTEEKKLWKQDGAVYSYMSMNVGGETAGDGILNLTADNEGLDTELHLTINGGNINIFADNDGINTNEDGVSVTTINGGNIHILAGLGAEGDGIDSNGWLVINGGTVIASANPAADAGLDSDMGSYINGGTVLAMGSTMDWAESDSRQVTMNLQFAEYQEFGDVIQIRNASDDTPVFAFDPDADEVLAKSPRKYQGLILSSPELVQGETYHLHIGSLRQSFTGTDVRRGPGGMGFGGMEPPEGFNPGERPEGPGGQGPNGQVIPGGQPGQMPGNFDPSQMKPGELPEEMEPPEGFDPSQFQGGQMPDGFSSRTIVETGEASIEFYMQDKVNAFSGVAGEAK